MCSIENDFKDFKLTKFFLNENVQMLKFKFFVLRGKFYKVSQIFLEFANIEHNWKIEKLKNYLEKQLKNWYVFWKA